MFRTRKEIIDYLESRKTFGMCAGIIFYWSPISNCVEKLEAYSTEYFVIEDILKMWEEQKKSLRLEYLTYFCYPDGEHTYKSVSNGWATVMTKLSEHE